MSEPLDTGAAVSWNIVFFGSAEFSLPALKALHDGPDRVALVVCPPPAPSGRGRKLSPSPVAVLAEKLGLKVLEAKNFKNTDTIEAIRAAEPDLLAVAAYGGFLPQALLELCPFPPLNIHPSLLPRHRGAAPVNWCLINCDEEVGVSIIFLEKEMDAGPILSQRAFPVQGCECAGNLEKRLSEIGAEMLLNVIARLKTGENMAVIQNSERATVNPLLCKNDGLVDWNLPAAKLAGLINGVDPWPGARTPLDGKSLKIFQAAALPPREGHEPQPGLVLGLDEEARLLVETPDGLVALAELQPEGKKRMKAADFLRGYRPERLGQ
ncbi:methionyl-tRNA formyltransferase [Deltaproteobacteria bacterium Smac51]|nr:methionyl-tRNA formyltransferase [Deltaproteobacteria bacterium Smac51]